jgi:hypothetical protein
MKSGNQPKDNPLWNYPIWEHQTDFDEKFNEDLLDEIYYIAQQISKEENPKDSLWDYDMPMLRILKTSLTSITNNIVSTSIPEIRELNYKFKCDMAWPNVREPGQSIELHAHPDASFGVTYYIKADNDCGDFIAYVKNGNPVRITPKAGKVLILPAYILHEIEPNMSKSLRVSISTDFTQIVDKSADNALVLKSWCLDMLKVRDWNSTN